MMNNSKYYQIAKEASIRIDNHQGLKTIRHLARKSRNILDVGCGEGTRLNNFVGKGKIGTGFDLNSYAINMAKKQYPRHQFILGQSESLPFPPNTFDLVYSTFVLEHTQDQELFIKEIIRVAEADGGIVILCPNYGAPNRRSPVSVENPLKKLIFGFFNDFFPLPSKNLFTKVSPKKVFKNPDDDTTCEPYLLGLIRHLKQFSEVEIVSHSSLWEVDDQAISLHQRLFKFLGTWHIFLFKHWGPQLFIQLKKLP